jgi:hypothetical protein
MSKTYTLWKNGQMENAYEGATAAIEGLKNEPIGRLDEGVELRDDSGQKVASKFVEREEHNSGHLLGGTSKEVTKFDLKESFGRELKNERYDVGQLKLKEPEFIRQLESMGGNFGAGKDRAATGKALTERSWMQQLIAAPATSQQPDTPQSDFQIWLLQEQSKVTQGQDQQQAQQQGQGRAQEQEMSF